MALEAGAQKKVSDLEEEGNVAGLEALKVEAEQVDMNFEAAGAIEEAIGRLKVKAESSQTTPEESATIASVGGTQEEADLRTTEVDAEARNVATEAEANILALEVDETKNPNSESVNSDLEGVESQIKLIEDQLRESSDKLNNYRKGAEDLIISKGYEKRLNDLRDRINASREERAIDMGENMANFKMRLDEAKKAIEKSPDSVKKKFALRDIEDLLTELGPYDAGNFYQYQQKYLSDGIETITTAMSPDDVKRLFPHVENGNRNVDKLILDRSLVERERDEDAEIVELRSKIKIEEDTRRDNFEKLEQLKNKSRESAR